MYSPLSSVSVIRLIPPRPFFKTAVQQAADSPAPVVFPVAFKGQQRSQAKGIRYFASALMLTLPFLMSGQRSTLQHGYPSQSAEPVSTSLAVPLPNLDFTARGQELERLESVRKAMHPFSFFQLPNYTWNALRRDDMEKQIDTQRTALNADIRQAVLQAKQAAPQYRDKLNKHRLDPADERLVEQFTPNSLRVVSSQAPHYSWHRESGSLFLQHLKSYFEKHGQNGTFEEAVQQFEPYIQRNGYDIAFQMPQVSRHPSLALQAVGTFDFALIIRGSAKAYEGFDENKSFENDVKAAQSIADVLGVNKQSVQVVREPKSLEDLEQHFKGLADRAKQFAERMGYVPRIVVTWIGHGGKGKEPLLLDLSPEELDAGGRDGSILLSRQAGQTDFELTEEALKKLEAQYLAAPFKHIVHMMHSCYSGNFLARQLEQKTDGNWVVRLTPSSIKKALDTVG